MTEQWVLVTGGAGYVGSQALRELLASGYRAVVFDNLSAGHRAAVPRDVPFVLGDLREPGDVAAVFRSHRIDAILHFAARSLVGESVREPFVYFKDNTLGLLNLVECAVGHGVERIVLSSTANLFDEPGDLPIREDVAVRPGSPYGESKHFCERILYWAEQLHGLRSASLRYFNAAGADPSGAHGEDHDPETHLIPLLCQVALGQRPHIEIFGTDYPTHDGTCVRDYVHVVDLARAHVLALEALKQGGHLRYNLGNGQGYSVKEVIETARQVTGREIPVVPGPRRLGDPAVLIASSERIRQDLGWQPRFSNLTSIVESAWRWHLRHPEGYAGARSHGSPELADSPAE